MNTFQNLLDDFWRAGVEFHLFSSYYETTLTVHHEGRPVFKIVIDELSPEGKSMVHDLVWAFDAEDFPSEIQTYYRLFHDFGGEIHER